METSLKKFISTIQSTQVALATTDPLTLAKFPISDNQEETVLVD